MKKFHWNWGWGIFTFYVFFMLATLAFVFFTLGVDEDLVTHDYYDQSLVYQKHIDATQNALDVSQPVTWKVENAGSRLYVSYPAKLVSGTITLYRPSNSALDRVINIQPDSSSGQVIGLQNLEAGYWKVKVNWKEGDKFYYQESRLVLNRK